jgi:cation-transporting P-type ATPase C
VFPAPEILPPPEGMRTGQLTIVHELPRRLRLGLPLTADPAVDVDYFKAYLEALDGVGQVRVNPHARCLVVDYDGRLAVKEALLEQLCGRDHVLNRFAASSRRSEPDLAPIITSALAVLSLPFLSMPLKAAVTFISIGGTVARGCAKLLERGISVDVLDAVAVGLAAVRGHYFTANVTNLLVKTGDYLEHKAERHTEHVLKALLHQPPGRAWVERGVVTAQIAASEIREGDAVRVGPGDSIPVDGWILTGTALVNQASVTGESLPVRKEQDDAVLAGCVVAEGHLRVQATRVGEKTTTARIARFIEQALQRPSETQRTVDRLADRLVYVNLGVGGLLCLLTRQPHRLTSAFLVDYSCALKLGTPMAFRVGMYQGATDGLLFRGARAMEALARADTVVLDKTGTLTSGEFQVTDVIPLREGLSEHGLLALVVSLEEHARHPFADAVVRHAKAKKLPHIDHGEVEFIVAHGLNTLVGGYRAVVGSAHYLAEHERIPIAASREITDALEAEGKTLLYVAEGKRLVGIVALQDEPRPDAADALEQLRALGIKRLVMLSGDQRHKAESVAEQLGIDQVHAEMRPEEKAQVVEGLKTNGHRVVFVGDGVNDAPALTVADVGISMPRGALLSRETADLVLLRDRLLDLAAARELAGRTMTLDTRQLRYRGECQLGGVVGRIPRLVVSRGHRLPTQRHDPRNLAQCAARAEASRNCRRAPQGIPCLAR